MIVKFVPKFAKLCIGKKQAVEGKGDEDLADHFHAESAHGQQPGGYAMRAPQEEQAARGHQGQDGAYREGPGVSCHVWVGRCSKGHEDGVHGVVYKVEEAGEEKKKVAAQPNDACRRFECAQAILEGQNDEKHRGDGSNMRDLVVWYQQELLALDVNLVGCKQNFKMMRKKNTLKTQEILRTYPVIQLKMEAMPRMAGSVSHPRTSRTLPRVVQFSFASDSNVDEDRNTENKRAVRRSQKVRKMSGMFSRSHSVSAKAINPSALMKEATYPVRSMTSLHT